MKLITLIIILLSSFLFPLFAGAEDLAFFEKHLGSPPPGFKWYLCHHGYMAIRQPLGWFTREDGPSPKGVMSCFITKENIDSPNSEFDTGFSINILPDFLNKYRRQPSDFMKFYIDSIAISTVEARGKIEERFENQIGPLKGLAIRVTRALPSEVKKNTRITTVHHFLIANDKTSTLYVSTFESPTEGWGEAWKMGEPIVQKLGILVNN